MPTIILHLRIIAAVLALLISVPGISQTMDPDSIGPPFPPLEPGGIEGLNTICVGDVAFYTTDIPVGCECNWYINGQPQSSNDCEIEVSWMQTGLQLLFVEFDCQGQILPGSTLEVVVNDVPTQPQTIQGDTLICEYTTHTYNTTVGPYDSCEWRVDGELQASISPSMTYSFGGAASYLIEVKAFNNCGISTVQSQMVYASGEAPEPPEPIQGPESSCLGNTDIYTTLIGPGESCEWRLNGVLQPVSGTTLSVEWNETGGQLIEVRAVSDCGTGNPTLLQVMVWHEPIVDLGNDTSILQGDSFVLDAGNPGSEFLWSTGASTQSIVVSETGSYSVQVMNFCGSDSDTILVDFFVGLNEIPEKLWIDVYAWDGKLYTQCLMNKLERIRIVSIIGTLVYEGPCHNEIPLPSSGVYIVQGLTEEGWVGRKIWAP